MQTAPRHTPSLSLARWALFLTAAAAPAFVWRWKVGPFPTTLLENLILLTVAIYLVGCRQRRIPPLVRTPYDLPIALLLAAGALATAVAPDHRAALGLYRAYLLEPCAIYYVVAGLRRVTDPVRSTVLGLALGGTVLAILNLRAFALAAAAGTLNIAVAAPVAVYTSGNAVAMYLEPLVALGLGFVLFGTRSRDRWVAAACLLILAPALLLTFSRGGFLALAALAVIAVLSVRRKLELLVAAVAAAGLLIWRIPLIAERIAHELNAHDPNNSFIQRLAVWRAALKMLRDHPLFGAGLSGFQATVRRYIPPGGATDAIYPHNLWLAFWSELGLLGLIAFGLIYFGLVWRGWRGLATTPQSARPILWGVVAALVMIAVHGLVDSPYWKNDLSLEFWLLAGIEVAVMATTGALVIERGHQPRSRA
jgi:O-antigen ligase